MENNYYPFYNIPLPFEFDALEPYIDAKTMHLHHDKHLQTYIDNLNNILKSETWLQKMSLEQLIVNSENLPEKLKTPVKNNAGGVYNHRFFFSCLKNPAASQPAGRLGRKINMQFKGFENFKQELKKAALSVFGSGYAWLIYENHELKITTTPNQNCPIENGAYPILTIDVWEHAYYLKHYNLRADYFDDWINIIDWDKAEQNLLNAILTSCRSNSKTGENLRNKL